MDNQRYDMTPSSGIDVPPDGIFSIGCEVAFPAPSPGGSFYNYAVKSAPIPDGKTGIQFIGGLVKCGPDPAQLGDEVFLYRIHLSQNEDDTSGTIILEGAPETFNQPANIPVGMSPVIPISPDKKFLVVELQYAGGRKGARMEMEITGMFS